MKNMVLLLATSFLLISSTSAFGQNNLYLQKVPNPNQIDLFSAEIFSLVNFIVKEADVFYTDEKLSLESKKADNLNLDKISASVRTLDITPINYNISMLEARSINEDTSSNGNAFSEFVKPLNFPAHSNLGIQHAFPDHNNLQSFVKENCESIKCLNSKTGWFELDRKDWEPTDKMNPKPAVSGFGDWRFKVGSLENNYLSVPIQL